MPGAPEGPESTGGSYYNRIWRFLPRSPGPKQGCNPQSIHELPPDAPQPEMILGIPMQRVPYPDQTPFRKATGEHGLDLEKPRGGASERMRALWEASRKLLLAAIPWLALGGVVGYTYVRHDQHENEVQDFLLERSALERENARLRTLYRGSIASESAALEGIVELGKRERALKKEILVQDDRIDVLWREVERLRGENAALKKALYGPKNPEE